MNRARLFRVEHRARRCLSLANLTVETGVRCFRHLYTTVLLAGDLRLRLRLRLSLFYPFPFLTAKETAAKHCRAIQPASGTGYPQVGLCRVSCARYRGGCANVGRAQQHAATERNTTSKAPLLYP